MTLTCLGCVKDIKDSNFIKCSICYEFCHLLCANTGSKKSIKDLKWVCPNCVSKRPKGNNTNTPVRQVECKGKQSPNWLSQRSQSKTCVSPTLNIPDTEHRCLSKDDIRDIIQCEIKNSFTKGFTDFIKNTIVAELRGVKTEIANLKYEITTLKDSMNFINSEFEDIRCEINNKFEINKRLQKDMLELYTANKKLELRLQEIEQHTRATNIELQCVPEYKAENLINLTEQLAKTVSFDLNINDIHMCTRVAKTNPSSSRPKSIIVKLRSPLVRDGLLAAVLKFNKNQPKDKLNSGHLGIGGDKKPVYVVEHLSSHNRILHKAARLKAKDLGYKFVWVRGGRVLVRKTETSPSIVIKDLDSVKNLT